MNRYIIIADDFTGANDSGVQLKRRGIKTDVVFSTELMSSKEKSYVIDTESRGMDGEEAYKCLYDTSAKINLDEFKYVIKKVDSTLRGNIPEEIKGLDELFKSELIIFAPALPDLNRTTVNGIHKLNGTPITETELARDPKKPVVEDNLSKILGKVFTENITHIYLNDIEKEKIDLSKGRIFSFDSLTNKHMQIVLMKALATGKKIMWVGTAAMVENLMEVERKTKPSMAMVGSVSSVTREQVKYAEEKGINLLKIPMYELLEADSRNIYVDKAVELLKEGKDLIVLSSSAYSIDEYNKTNEVGYKHNMSNDEISMFTQNMLGDISKEIIDRVDISGVFLTGGDTARGFFEKSEALGSSIVGEVMIGIPLMKLRGGVSDGLNVITKAGAFGNLDTIYYSMRKLKEVI